MRIIVLVAAVIVLVSGPSHSAEICTILFDKFDFTFRQMAMIEAQGMTDKSTSRKTNRQLELLNHRIEQMIYLQFASQHKCTFPNEIGSLYFYMISALECVNDRLVGKNDSQKCEISKWKSINKK